MESLRKNLTIEEFEAAIDGRDFEEKTKEIGRRSLVNGEAVADLIKAFGVKRAWIYGIRNAIYAAHLEKKNYPPDWVTRTVTASRELFSEFDKRIEEERRGYFTQIRSGKIISEPKRRSKPVKSLAKGRQ